MRRKRVVRNPAVRLRGFDAFVLRRMKEWHVPGVAVGVVKDGRPIHIRGYGLRHVGSRLPVTGRTCFAIGSCTKAFTGTAMGILVDEGKVDWDTPVREYLPSFRMRDPVASKLMTARDLLTHRSGLPRHDMVWSGTSDDRDALFKRLRYLEPSKLFRSVYQYNNLMFMAAGVLIERRAGCSWEQFVRQRILEPLGMSSVTFANVAMAQGEDFALGYDRRGKRVVHVPHENVVPVGPAGSMNANVVDMCRWVAFQMSRGKKGRKRIISEQALKTIHTPQVVFQEDEPYEELLDPSYAMGWTVQAYRGRRRLKHGGCVDGFNAGTSFLPDDRLGVVVLTNVTRSPLTRVLAYNVYDRFLGPDEIPWSARLKRLECKKRADARSRRTSRKHEGRTSHPLRAYVGQYEHRGYGRLTVTLEGGKLRATYNGITRSLKHEHHDEFGMLFRGTWPGPNRKVTFRLGKDGRINSLAAALQEGVRDIVFRRIGTKPDRRRRARSKR